MSRQQCPVAGAPYSWTIDPKTPPYYESVAIQHGYLRVEANRTALAMEASSAGLKCIALNLGQLCPQLKASRDPWTTPWDPQ